MGYWKGTAHNVAISMIRPIYYYLMNWRKSKAHERQDRKVCHVGIVSEIIMINIGNATATQKADEWGLML